MPCIRDGLSTSNILTHYQFGHSDRKGHAARHKEHHLVLLDKSCDTEGLRHFIVFYALGRFQLDWVGECGDQRWIRLNATNSVWADLHDGILFFCDSDQEL